MSLNFLLPNDALPLVRSEGFTQSAASLRLLGHAGRTLVLETTADFRQPAWQPVATNTAVRGGVLFAESPARTGSSRFYRVKEN